MNNIMMATELAAFQEALQELQEELDYIRRLVMNADAKARKLYQGVDMVIRELVQPPLLPLFLSHISNNLQDTPSPEAPVTPTCPFVPWGENDDATDFEDDGNTSSDEKRAVES
jgi:hypothetical protein